MNAKALMEKANIHITYFTKKIVDILQTRSKKNRGAKRMLNT